LGAAGVSQNEAADLSTLFDVGGIIGTCASHRAFVFLRAS